MNKPAFNTTARILILLLILSVVLFISYQQLSDAQKRFVQNLLRQLPYLPARYCV